MRFILNLTAFQPTKHDVVQLHVGAEIDQRFSFQRLRPGREALAGVHDYSCRAIHK